MPSDLSPKSQKKVETEHKKSQNQNSHLLFAKRTQTNQRQSNSNVTHNGTAYSRPRSNALGGRKTGKRKSKKNRKNKTFMKM